MTGMVERPEHLRCYSVRSKEKEIIDCRKD